MSNVMSNIMLYQFGNFCHFSHYLNSIFSGMSDELVGVLVLVGALILGGVALAWVWRQWRRQRRVAQRLAVDDREAQDGLEEETELAVLGPTGNAGESRV